MFSRSKPIQPASGQESVWDYPRPPRLEHCTKSIQIIFNGTVIAETKHSFRVLEMSHPPVYYLPPGAIQQQYLQAMPGQSFCEWKGLANYYSVSVGEKVLHKVAWYYSQPTDAFAEIKDYVAFYAAPMDACYIDGEEVIPQPGGFYGGWITQNIVGPFKGEPGSFDW